MKSELLPCPFCGGAARQENYVLEAAVFCSGCRARITRGHTSKRDVGLPQSAAAWNARASQQAASADIRELVECLARYVEQDVITNLTHNNLYRTASSLLSKHTEQGD